MNKPVGKVVFSPSSRTRWRMFYNQMGVKGLVDHKRMVLYLNYVGWRNVLKYSW